MSTPVPSAVADAFEHQYGHAPDGVWSAPGRVNLIGEHTDYNRGLVLPFAIDRRTWCAARLTDNRTFRVASTSQDAVAVVEIADLPSATFSGWTGYALGVPWAIGLAGYDLTKMRGVDLLIDSHVPIGAGLSSSAAIESSIVAALRDLWRLPLSLMDMAAIGQRAENGAVGAPTGIMDQVASVFGHEDHAVLLDCASLEVTSVPLALAEQGLEVLVIDTHVSHSHATGGYAARRTACERAAATLGLESLRSLGVDGLAHAQRVLDDETFRRARHVVTENARVLDTVAALSTGGPRSIGALLAASHASMKDDFEISVPEIDTAVAAAVGAGAVGARLTGGGFGGAAIALVESANRDAVIVAVEAAFQERGFARPSTLTVTPSDGARRDV